MKWWVGHRATESEAIEGKVFKGRCYGLNTKKKKEGEKGACCLGDVVLDFVVASCMVAEWDWLCAGYISMEDAEMEWKQ